LCTGLYFCQEGLFGSCLAGGAFFFLPALGMGISMASVATAAALAADCCSFKISCFLASSAAFRAAAAASFAASRSRKAFAAASASSRASLSASSASALALSRAAFLAAASFGSYKVSQVPKWINRPVKIQQSGKRLLWHHTTRAHLLQQTTSFLERTNLIFL
jgi:hypothetical protein